MKEEDLETVVSEEDDITFDDASSDREESDEGIKGSEQSSSESE